MFKIMVPIDFPQHSTPSQAIISLDALVSNPKFIENNENNEILLFSKTLDEAYSIFKVRKEIEACLNELKSTAKSDASKTIISTLSKPLSIIEAREEKLRKEQIIELDIEFADLSGLLENLILESGSSLDIVEVVRQKFPNENVFTDNEVESLKLTNTIAIFEARYSDELKRADFLMKRDETIKEKCQKYLTVQQN